MNVEILQIFKDSGEKMDKYESRGKRVEKNVPNTRNTVKGLMKEKKQKQKKDKDSGGLPEGMNVIHPAHENFNMVFNIMLGIKKAVDSTLDLPLLKVTDKDFNVKCKYEIAPYRTGQGDSVKACTFYDYAPQIFAQIRKCSGIKK